MRLKKMFMKKQFILLCLSCDLALLTSVEASRLATVTVEFWDALTPRVSGLVRSVKRAPSTFDLRPQEEMAVMTAGQKRSVSARGCHPWPSKAWMSGVVEAEWATGMRPQEKRGLFGRTPSLLRPYPPVESSVSGWGAVRLMSTDLSDRKKEEKQSFGLLRPLLKHPPLYGIPTYDALFQSLVNHQQIRDSFFHAFIPDMSLVSSRRLDEYMSPHEGIQYVREHVDDLGVAAPPSFRRLVDRFTPRETKLAFPRRHRYYGTTDFVGQLDNGDNIIVQLSPVVHSFWDRRALACSVAFSGYQMSRQLPYSPIHKVIGIHILGNIREKAFWVPSETSLLQGFTAHPDRHTPVLHIGDIELEGYSIQDFPRKSLSPTQKDWITFFRTGPYMDEEQVQTRIQDPIVRQAFALARIEEFSEDLRELYEEQDHEYDKYSQHTNDMVRIGQEEVLIDLVKNWHKKGKTLPDIAELLEKDEDWVREALDTLDQPKSNEHA